MVGNEHGLVGQSFALAHLLTHHVLNIMEARMHVGELALCLLARFLAGTLHWDATDLFSARKLARIAFAQVAVIITSPRTPPSAGD